jgi:RNA polymerase sigma factor (sigma-70 family)
MDQLRRAVLLPDGAGLGDAVLLARFIENHDEPAFAVLVTRHGPMVWGVCRRLLHQHDAEDAFQATFLVLARKAASIRSKEMVGNWLYGVAHQTALQARRTAARRRTKEVQVTKMPDIEAVAHDPWSDIQPVLDEELSRLPDIYRTAIVLCDLEGRTRREVASKLGVPEGTVAARVARARSMLAKRLSQRGVSLSSGALAMLLAQQVTEAVPRSMVVSTIKAASVFVAGPATATGAVSVEVAALTEKVIKLMFFNKLKSAVAVMLILGFLATGTTLLAHRAAARQDDPGDRQPVAQKPVESAVKHDKEAFTAWGKEVGGLQAGLGLKPGQKRAYSQGETVTAVLRIRNVGKEAVDFKHIWAFFVENPPKITDADGKMVQLPKYKTRDQELHMPRICNVAPGKAVELYEWTFDLQPEAEESSRAFIHGTGKFSLQCERIVGPTWLNPAHPNPTLDKLATGKLELEITAKPPVKPAAKQVNENLAPSPDDIFTAWGKEINGLQAGLAIRAGDVRAYHPGETVPLSIRVRNNGKETVKFEYLRQYFMEMPPTVTDGAGNPFPRVRYRVSGEVHLPVEVNLEPGKEIELHEMKLELKPGNKTASGKVSIQYERVFGDTGAGQITLDPAFSKLATGKLELVFESEPPPAKTEKEASTAWGTEVGGMQVGLGFRAGEHRDYHIGETVTLVVRVRNVGKQDTNLEYMREYLQNSPPKIVDDKGKSYPTPTTFNFFGEQTPVQLTLGPGKESDLYPLKLVLRPASEKENRKVMEIYGTGRFQIQETGLLGNSWTGTTRINTAFSGMFSGKLELQVKDGLPSMPKPNEPEGAEPGSKRLTPQQVNKLFPESASIRYVDFSAILE